MFGFINRVFRNDSKALKQEVQQLKAEQKAMRDRMVKFGIDVSVLDDKIEHYATKPEAVDSTIAPACAKQADGNEYLFVRDFLMESGIPVASTSIVRGVSRRASSMCRKMSVKVELDVMSPHQKPGYKAGHANKYPRYILAAALTKHRMEQK